MTARRTILIGFAVSALLGASGASALLGVSGAEAQTVSPPPQRMALQGYDPVAYFTDAKPVEGSADYELVWDGQRYRFASAQHRDLFKANPDRYAPQFGGSCAMNMSSGVRRESDPHNWTIANGNLYVFAGAAGKEAFGKDIATNNAKAMTNWKSVKASQ